MTVRQWSAHVFAAFVPDGFFGRYVGYAHTREEAQFLVAQALRERKAASNSGMMSAPGGSAQTLEPPDDLNPDPDHAGSEAPA